MGSVAKRPRGRPPKTGGWQQLSTRLSAEWSKACDLLPVEHNTTLAQKMAQAIADDPMRALQVLSSYIPKNIQVELNEGTFSDALAQASVLMRSENATPVIIDQETEKKEQE